MGDLKRFSAELTERDWGWQLAHADHYAASHIADVNGASVVIDL
jgi:hypothetical protein